jgi:hypothetical protein
VEQSWTWFVKKTGSLEALYQIAAERKYLIRVHEAARKPVIQKAELAPVTVLVELSGSNSIELLWNIDYLADQVSVCRL